MALSVTITGGEDIDQGDRVTLSATVEDTNGNTPPGTLEYAWSASRGTFVGTTDEATAVYHADFTDTGAVDVTITCNVTRPANATPASSGPALTALAEIGVTGILVNMFLTDLGAVSSNTNNVLYNASTGAIDSGSDQRLASNINVYQLRWDNTNNNFVLNNNEAGNIGTFFTGNNNQSVYIIFADGTYEKLTPADFAAGTSRGQTWARWLVTDANILTLLNALSTTDDLVVGVADADSIGWDADSGSDTETFSAAAPLPLAIESIDEQFVPLGTTDYDLVIDIAGKPDTVEASGHMEGFAQHWDAVNGQLHIRSKEVTRLISGVFWTIKITKGTQTLTADIAYNVVKAAPIFQTLVMLHLYRDVPINIDILIQNIPDLIVPNSKLIGLKSTLQDYGLNIGGELAADANFSVNEGDISVIVPSETGGTSEMHDYAYQIESGHPPAIGTPVFTPKGGHGTLEFTDVTHALGYEWTVQEGDADRVDWSVFDSTRQLINPDTVEVTPGHLQVTIKFPNIAGASSYAYRLESDDHEVDWKKFTGTLADGMITTIIPDLEEGVEYTLRLRVASPWVGTPVSIEIFGGRIAYCVSYNGLDGVDSALYIFHTGVPQGGQSRLIKRILLPTGLTHPQGVAVSGTTAYCAKERNPDRGIYVFSTETAHNTRAPLLRKFYLPSNSGSLYDVALFGDDLYVSNPISPSQSSFSFGGEIYTVDPNTANNATAVAKQVWDINQTLSHHKLSITDDFIYASGNVGVSAPACRTYERVPLSYETIIYVNSFAGIPSSGRSGTVRHGIHVIGNTLYAAVQGADELRTYELTESRPPVVKSFGLPPGCTQVTGLDIPG